MSHRKNPIPTPVSRGNGRVNLKRSPVVMVTSCCSSAMAASSGSGSSLSGSSLVELGAGNV